MGEIENAARDVAWLAAICLSLGVVQGLQGVRRARQASPSGSLVNVLPRRPPSAARAATQASPGRYVLTIPAPPTERVDPAQSESPLTNVGEEPVPDRGEPGIAISVLGLSK